MLSYEKKNLYMTTKGNKKYKEGSVVIQKDEIIRSIFLELNLGKLLLLQFMYYLIMCINALLSQFIKIVKKKNKQKTSECFDFYEINAIACIEIVDNFCEQLGTRSSNTGPDNAHTGFQYVYIEASGKSRQAGDKAVMSTNIQLSSKSYKNL